MAGALRPPAPASAGAPTNTRRLRWWAVVAAVLAAHAWVTSWWSQQLAPLDARLRGAPRLQAAYTRQVALADTDPVAAAAVAPAAPPAPRRVAAATTAVEAAASAAAVPASAPPTETPPAETASLTERVPDAAPAESVSAAASAPELAPALAAASDATAVEAAAAQAAASAALVAASQAAAVAALDPTATVAAASAAAPASASTAGVTFDWPASTRISYQLTGWYRGEVEGSAQVEWLREGDRYQVHVDVVIGPSFAPLGKRRMSSEGTITAAGLAPRRYEQVTSQIIGSSRTLQLHMDGAQVQLANGQRVPQLANMQDTASQFVQLIWLFTTQPGLLAVGRSIEIPLALPRRVERFVYDVVEEERLASRFGEIPTLHVKPRRAVPLPGDLAIEMWFAPRLQNLPVRFMIRQDETNFVDLRIDRLPEQAAPAAPSAPLPRN